MPNILAVAKAIVGTKIPRPHGRAGSIPALGTNNVCYVITGSSDQAAFSAAFLLPGKYNC